MPLLPLFPVIFHQVSDPFRLRNSALGLKFVEYRLYIQHRGAVNGIQALNGDAAAIMSQQLHGTQPQLIGPVFLALAKDTHERISSIAPRPARINDSIIWDFIKIEYDLEVREEFYACKSLRGYMIGQGYFCEHIAPQVVCYFFARVGGSSNGL